MKNIIQQKLQFVPFLYINIFTRQFWGETTILKIQSKMEMRECKSTYSSKNLILKEYEVRKLLLVKKK